LKVQAIKFGLLAATPTELADIQRMVVRAGHIVVASVTVEATKLKPLPEVEAWVVRLGGEDDTDEPLIDLLDCLSTPIIYDDLEVETTPNIDERSRRFAAKVQQCCADVSGFVGVREQSSDRSNSSDVKRRAQEVWVLGASTGGPEAVTAFLDCLPKGVTGVAFIYVQHINSEISDTLRKVLVRHTSWQVFNCEKAHLIAEQSIYIVSPANQVSIHDTGILAPHPDAWLGPYSPSIDQVMAKLARVYGHSSGAIIFSGMGDDGSKSCAYMHHYGGTVWAQSPLSCTVDSMPVSAINTGVVSYQGSPENLAKRFAHERHSKQAAF
jgi:Chemotaxis response regulator containing a CheY-like receiver domain and a methylesterase domain